MTSDRLGFFTCQKCGQPIAAVVEHNGHANLRTFDSDGGAIYWHQSTPECPHCQQARTFYPHPSAASQE